MLFKVLFAFKRFLKPTVHSASEMSWLTVLKVDLRIFVIKNLLARTKFAPEVQIIKHTAHLRGRKRLEDGLLFALWTCK